MVIHCKFNHRSDDKGNIFADWCSVGEPFPYFDIELVADSIEVDYLEYSAQIHCHDGDKHYTLFQRNIHSFLESHDAPR